MKMSKLLLTGAIGLVTLGLAACGGGSSSGGSSAGSGETKVFKLAFNQTDQHPQYAAGVELGDEGVEAPRAVRGAVHEDERRCRHPEADR